MGTNYYAKINACPCCGHTEEGVHIGKSSGGWCFALHVAPEYGLTDWDKWQEFLTKPNVTIEDEYHTSISLRELKEVVENRSWGYCRGDWEYEVNHAELGPNNLVRCKVDGRHCVGQGEGTWDLIAGEFS